MLISVELYTQLIEELGFLKGKNRAIEKELEELKQPISIEEAEELRKERYTTIPEAEYRGLIEQKSYAEGRIAELEKQLEEIKRKDLITIDKEPYKIILEEEKCEK